MARSWHWSGWSRSWLACLVTLAVASGCGKNEAENVESPRADTPSSAAADPPGERPSAPDTANPPDPQTLPQPLPQPLNDEDIMEVIKARVAEHHGLAPDEIKVKVFDVEKGTLASNVTLFSAQQTTGRGPSRKFSLGVVHEGKVELDREAAMQVAVKAWGYGAKRTVPPDAVARVVGVLEGTRSTPKPILTQKDLDFFKKTGRPEYADAAFLPRETEVDGLPAVEFCNRADRPAFWIATAVFHPDGTVEVRRKSVP